MRLPMATRSDQRFLATEWSLMSLLRGTLTVGPPIRTMNHGTSMINRIDSGRPRPAMGASFRRGFWAVAVVLGLMLTACHQRESPILITNKGPEIGLKAFDTRGDGYFAPIRLRKGEGGPLLPVVIFQSGEEKPIFFEGVVQRAGYTLVVQNPEGIELFQGTFFREELDRRKFRIAITSKGFAE